MGCYDTVLVKCPSCGKENDFQSKGGECILSTFTLEKAPIDVMYDVNRHSPMPCFNCGAMFKVKFDVTVETCKCCKHVEVKIINRRAEICLLEVNHE